MDVYDPKQTPDPEVWLELDESTRMDTVQAYHAAVEIELPDEASHAAVHVIVENQLALGVEPVPEVLDRLVRQGLDRHEAIHAIGAVLSEDILNLLGSNQTQWDRDGYRNRLGKLTARRWRKGEW